MQSGIETGPTSEGLTITQDGDGKIVIEGAAPDVLDRIKACLNGEWWLKGSPNGILTFAAVTTKLPPPILQESAA